MAITLNQVQRLAYIRYLHQLGIDQARQPDPLSSVAVLMMHDAVESFLLLVAEHLGVTSREFEKYWREFEPHLPDGIGFPEKTSMTRLNKMRVGLKHHGSQPNKQTVEQAASDVSTFFSAATQLVFGIDYGAITMVNLISQNLVRQLAEEAENSATAGDIVKGMIRLREAFDHLFAAHDPSQLPQRWSGLTFGPYLDDRPHLVVGDQDQSSELEQLKDAVRPMQTAIRLTALSIDYAEYLRFDLLTPESFRRYDDVVDWMAPQGYAPDKGEFDFCLRFVVTASLRLAAAESQLSDPTWVLRDPAGRITMEFIREDWPLEDRLRQSPAQLDSSRASDV